MKRGKFSLSHYKLLSCDMGELIPIGLIEVLPGDTFQHATSMLLRVSPLLAPVMHPVHVRIHHWFVPHRLVWDNWEKFITGGPDGMDASAFPYRSSPAVTGHAVGSLPDYLGVPTDVPNLEYSALPIRAYQTIFNEWYRDQDLVTAAAVVKTDGADSTTSITKQNVAWEKDYFTTARPWTQKGPEVTVPLGDTAPVVKDANGPTGGAPQFTGGGKDNFYLQGNNGASSVISSGGNFNATNNLTWGLQTGLEADLSGATSASINALREAFALQRYEEARARYGSRYTEYLRYLGIRSSDARLQRPEYLGGGRQTIQFSEVLQTGVSVDDEGETIGEVGSLKGHGIAALRSNRYRRFFEEHGYVVSLLSVLPKTIYAQGLSRTWNRRTKEDFFQKELQHIGQQEVLNKEIYTPSGTLSGTFGYQDRYDEYRRQESGVAGEFRTTLDFWHMARIFSAAPTLNGDFVTSNPTKRINAVQSSDALWIMANHSIQARRIVAPSAKSYIY